MLKRGRLHGHPAQRARAQSEQKKNNNMARGEGFAAGDGNAGLLATYGSNNGGDALAAGSARQQQQQQRYQAP